jgi:hypothetical protein
VVEKCTKRKKKTPQDAPVSKGSTGYTDLYQHPNKSPIEKETMFKSPYVEAPAPSSNSSHPFSSVLDGNVSEQVLPPLPNAATVLP